MALLLTSTVRGGRYFPVLRVVGVVVVGILPFPIEEAALAVLTIVKCVYVANAEIDDLKGSFFEWGGNCSWLSRWSRSSTNTAAACESQCYRAEKRRETHFGFVFENLEEPRS